MKSIPLFATIALSGLFLNSVLAQTFLGSGHTDVGVAYEDDAWDLHIHHEDTDTEYEPGDAIFAIGAAAQSVIPSDPNFAFLGTAGDTVWILPSEQNPALLFLGIGSEEIADGTFFDNEFTLTLSGFSGPGNFFLYDTDSFGTPSVLWSTNNGLIGSDTLTLTTGGHAHYNWAFTQAGTYSLTLTASALLPDQTPTSSSATYTFQTVPEPSVYALFILAGLFIILNSRRHRRLESTR